MISQPPHIFTRKAEVESSNTNYKKNISKSALRMERAGVPIIFTLKHLALLSECDYKELHRIVQRKISPYVAFKIPKKDKSLRTIFTPTEPLRKVQRFICKNILYSSFYSSSVHKKSFAYCKDASIFDNAEPHCGAKWLIKIDIEDFFPTCLEPQVYRIFLAMGYNPLFAFELTRLTTWPYNERHLHSSDICHSEYVAEKYSIYSSSLEALGALPQGAPSSPPLSNLLFTEIDKTIDKLSEEFFCVYTRYADDMYFSSNALTYCTGSLLIRRVAEVIGRHGFSLNKNKTKIFGPGKRKYVTGIIVNEQRPSLGKKFKEEIKKHIFFMKKNGIECQADFYNSKDANSFLSHIIGKINYAKMIDEKFASKCMQKIQKIICDAGYIKPKFY